MTSLSFIYFSLHWVFFSLTALGLHCWPWAFSSCGERSLLSSFGEWAFHCGGFSSGGARAVRAQASVVAAHKLSSRGTRAYLLHGMWNPPGPHVSPELGGRFLTTGPQGKFLRVCAK